MLFYYTHTYIIMLLVDLVTNSEIIELSVSV